MPASSMQASSSAAVDSSPTATQRGKAFMTKAFANTAQGLKAFTGPRTQGVPPKESPTWVIHSPEPGPQSQAPSREGGQLDAVTRSASASDAASRSPQTAFASGAQQGQLRGSDSVTEAGPVSKTAHPHGGQQDKVRRSGPASDVSSKPPWTASQELSDSIQYGSAEPADSSPWDQLQGKESGPGLSVRSSEPEPWAEQSELELRDSEPELRTRGMGPESGDSRMLPEAGTAPSPDHSTDGSVALPQPRPSPQFTGHQHLQQGSQGSPLLQNPGDPHTGDTAHDEVHTLPARRQPKAQQAQQAAPPVARDPAATPYVSSAVNTEEAEQAHQQQRYSRQLSGNPFQLDQAAATFDTSAPISNPALPGQFSGDLPQPADLPGSLTPGPLTSSDRMPTDTLVLQPSAATVPPTQLPSGQSSGSVPSGHEVMGTASSLADMLGSLHPAGWPPAPLTFSTVSLQGFSQLQKSATWLYLPKIPAVCFVASCSRLLAGLFGLITQGMPRPYTELLLQAGCSAPAMFNAFSCVMGVACCTAMLHA